MVPASDYFGLLSDFSILFALRLAHSTVSRNSFFLTSVLKTLWQLLISHTLFLDYLHSKQQSPWFRLCFTFHPHSGWAFQVSNFPYVIHKFSNSPLLMVSPFVKEFLFLCLLHRELYPHVSAKRSFSFSFSFFLPKGHFQNVFLFPTPPKEFHSALWLHSTLEILQ